MSVIRVSKDCIDILITAAMWKDWRHDDPSEGPFGWEVKNEDGTATRRTLDPWKPNPVGMMLDHANARAYAHRYGRREGKSPYVFERVEGCNPKNTERDKIPYLVASVVKEIKFYEYQTNEGRGWDESEPRAFCEALRARVLSFLWESVSSIPWGGDRSYYAQFTQSKARS